MSPEIISWTFLSPAQRGFEPIFVYLVTLQSFCHLVETYNAGSSHPFADDDWVQIGCNQDNEDWIWYPTPVAKEISQNIIPSSIRLGKTPGLPNPSQARVHFGAVGPLLSSFAQVIVPNFYEAHIASIEDRYGQEVSKWPPVWDFARVVRNSMSHGGKIHINGRHSQAVTWRGLRYEFADNDREILHYDLGPGDFFNLILEMDQWL